MVRLPSPPATRILRAVESLRKVQAQFVGSRLQRNVVGEISLPAAAVDDGILGTPDVLHRARTAFPPEK